MKIGDRVEYIGTMSALKRQVGTIEEVDSFPPFRSYKVLFTLPESKVWWWCDLAEISLFSTTVLNQELKGVIL